jgi:hypothetical protein
MRQTIRDRHIPLVPTYRCLSVRPSAIDHTDRFRVFLCCRNRLMDRYFRRIAKNTYTIVLHIDENRWCEKEVEKWSLMRWVGSIAWLVLLGRFLIFDSRTNKRLQNNFDITITRCRRNNWPILSSLRILIGIKQHIRLLSFTVNNAYIEINPETLHLPIPFQS